MEFQEKYSQLTANPQLKIATFAGGCFWCLQAPFDRQEGVIKSFAGYSFDQDNKFKLLSIIKANYREAVQVFFDPEVVTYQKLVDLFWLQIDPTDAGGQFYDRGHQYTTAIFYHNLNQKRIAQRSKKQLQQSHKFDQPIVTKIVAYFGFKLAEIEHQDFYKKSELRYLRYKKASGREAFVKQNYEKKLPSTN